MRERGWSIDTALKLEQEVTHIQSTLIGPLAGGPKPEQVVHIDPELAIVRIRRRL